MKIDKENFLIQPKHSPGFTLVGATISMGIASVISLAMLELVKMNTMNNKNTASAILWSQVSLEIDLILSKRATCRSIFTSFYPTPSATLTDYTSFPDGTQLVIPRDSNPSFAQNYQEKSNTGGVIEFLTIEARNANNDLGPTTTELTIHIEARKIYSDTPPVGSVALAHYDMDRVVRITRNASNDIASCTSTTPIDSSKNACESVGGVWTDTPVGTEPQCKALTPAQAPPVITPANLNPLSYQNLCAQGQTISGIDLSTGKALAGCTNSSPLSTGITNCQGGVISWVADNSIPSGGTYVCRSLPGADPNTNVPNDGRATIPPCQAGQHLTWDATTSAFQCTANFRASAATSSASGDPAAAANGICPNSSDMPVWNGNGYDCVEQYTPKTDLGSGISCISDPGGQMRFLQWTGTSYTCSSSVTPGFPACQSNQLLTWDGNNFVCAYLDGAQENTCTAGSRLLYDASATGTKKFKCVAITTFTAPPACTGYDQVLQYDGINGQFICINRRVINYDDCEIRAISNSGSTGTCTGFRVAVGFCSSTTSDSCHFRGSHQRYMQPDNTVAGFLRCCGLNSYTADGGELRGTQSSTVGTVLGAIGSAVVNQNDNYNVANLASCPSGEVLTGLCVTSSTGVPSCGGASVSAQCKRTSGNWSVAPHNGNVGTAGGYFVRHSGSCRFVKGENEGEWAQCGYNEVMVGACASGGMSLFTPAKCRWGLRSRSVHNEALCCPVK